MSRRTYIAGLLASIAMTSNLKAESLTATIGSSESSTQGVNVLGNIFEKMSAKPVDSHGHIRIEGMQYLTALSDQPDLTYSQLLSGRLSLFKETSFLDYSSDMSAGTFFAKGQSHLMVHEAYMETHGSPFKASLGRKIKEWSEVDRLWNLGIWEPVYAMDPLRPEESGLAGLFLNYNKPDWEVVAFATPINIPNVGPDVREDKGGLAADSRWYRPPSRNYDFNNNINIISYKLNIPDQLALVKNGGGAVMGRAGHKDRGPWMVISAGYLPVNELILQRAAFKSITTDKVDVTVTPEVTHHTVGSLDLGYTFRKMKASISYLQDDPKVKLPPGDLSIQKLLPVQVYSAAVDFSLVHMIDLPLDLQFAALKVFGGDIQDITADGKPDSFTMFDSRLKFTDAALIKIEGPLTNIFRHPLATRIKYIYDYNQRGALLKTELQYYPDKKWAVIMGGDVLGVQDENYNKSAFLNEFRANDRFYGGMTYVF